MDVVCIYIVGGNFIVVVIGYGRVKKVKSVMNLWVCFFVLMLCSLIREFWDCKVVYWGYIVLV